MRYQKERGEGGEIRKKGREQRLRNWGWVEKNQG